MDIKENTGIMFNNNQWTEGSNKPRVRGEINVGGKIMEIAMWVKKSANGNTYYSLALKDSQPKQDKKSEPTQTNSYPDMDDAIPF
jgi:hypothetical protein